MPRKPPGPRQILADNLQALLTKELSGPVVAQKAGIDRKSVNNMLRQRFKTNVEHIEAVARVFGLTSWQLLRPTDDIKNAPLAEDVEQLIDYFYRAPPAYRQTIMNVAGARPDERPTSATVGVAPGDRKTARR